MILQLLDEEGRPVMEVDFQDDEDIARIVRGVKVIAVVGLSPNEARPSWGVARYLQANDYRIVPVNPGQAGHTILGEKVYARLADIPATEGVEMVDIFRRSEAVGPIVDEALAHLPHLKSIWMQLGIRNDAAARKAEQRGIIVIQDRCPKIEFPRHL
ncbi:CoA-binding protein [Paracoccus sp. KCTC 42845]|uniref:CoA-binding protein n=2 Tax=Paracoccus aerius TaxID=1915382 RepID=A0ABS1S3P4_9RHOB|nr:CoA-binding protein [Paracoccus aerius]